MGACTSVVDEVEVLQGKLQLAENTVEALENEKQGFAEQIKRLKQDIGARDKELTELLDNYDSMQETLASLRSICIPPPTRGPDLTKWFKPY